MPTSGQFPQEQDYQELKKNADALYKWTNSPAGTPNVNLVGNNIKTLEDLKADVIQIASDAANLQTYISYDSPSSKRMIDDTSQPDGTQGDVTQDDDPTKNGRWTYHATTVEWIKNPVQPASEESVEELRAQDSLTINIGKITPLRVETRDGVRSPASNGVQPTYWNNCILSVVVEGSVEQIAGKYFRVAVLDNGFAGRTGVQIEEFDASTYETASSPRIIQGRTEGNFPYGKDLGVTTFTVWPASRRGLSITITVNGDGLPPDETPLSSATSGSPAWSWIVDPVNVRVNRAMSYDTHRGNYDKVFPLLDTIARDGIISPPNLAFNATLLSVSVQGAKKGRYYRVEFFVNGSPDLPGSDPNGWVFASYDAATYSTDSEASRVRLQNYTHPAPAVDRNIGVQTITVTCAEDDGVTFIITLDASTLPPYGTPIRSITTGQPDGRSWIVDPSQYVYAEEEPEPPVVSDGNLSVLVEADKDVFAGYASTDDCYEWGFGVNGANSIPNVKRTRRAPGTDIEAAVWADLWAQVTDWIGPSIFQDTRFPNRNSVFTGGNHTVDGKTTARNLQHLISVDGKPVVTFQGRARVVDIRFLNELMAANTVSEPSLTSEDERYVAWQKTWVRIREDGTMFVRNRFQAKPEITLLAQREYGPQTTNAGFDETIMFPGGQQGGRVAHALGIGSGPKIDYPNVNCFVLRSAANGQLACWMDQVFGAEKRVVGETFDLAFIGPTSAKTYHRALQVDADPSIGITLMPGEFYEWQACYQMTSARTASDGIDSIVQKDEDFQVVFDNGAFI